MAERPRKPPRPPINDPLAWVDKEKSSETSPTILENEKNKMTEEKKAVSSEYNDEFSKVDTKQLLRGLSTCLQLADENYNITYMNEAFLKMLSNAEADIRKELPSFDANKLMGVNMDLFHKDPAHQRKLLDGLKTPNSSISSEISIGGRTFNLTAVPLFSTNGKRVNTIVEWSEVTAYVEVTDAVFAIANGDLSKELKPCAKDERKVIQTLHESVGLLKNNIQSLKSEIQRLTMASNDGLLSERGRADLFPGEFAVVVDNVNKMLDASLLPIAEGNRILSLIAAGDLSEKVVMDCKGDHEKMKQAINDVHGAVTRTIQDVNAISNAIVDGNLAIAVEAKRHQGEYRTIIDAFERALTGLNDTFYQITGTIQQVAESATNFNTASQNAAANSERQSSAVEEITSAVEETDSQVRANMENANAANELIGITSEEASQGQVKMKAMSVAMNSINESAQSIAKIIKVIDEIAFQTNLLALNAAVEAARAGQYGRGFAVVAQEVRNLAGRSAKAARETADLIEDSTKRVKDGVNIAAETGLALDTIVTNVVKVKDLMSEISIASAEQSRGVSQVNIAMGQVASVARSASLQAEEQAVASNELAASASRTQQELSRFKLRPRQLQTGTLNLESLTPELLQQLQVMLAQFNAGNFPAATAPAKKSPKQVMPLDNDERGFGKF